MFVMADYVKNMTEEVLYDEYGLFEYLLFLLCSCIYLYHQVLHSLSPR